MDFKLVKLVLNCLDSREVVDFSPQITFFHGETATGKTSIAQIVDFCLGGDFPNTPALGQQLNSAELHLRSAKHSFVIRRDKGSAQVKVTWTNRDGTSESRLIPLVKTDVPAFGEIYNLSDLLLYLLELPNVKVPVNTTADEVSTARLSFRDIMWYCYLKQAFLDSSFFYLDENAESNHRRKSRFAFRYITKLYDENISELEVDLAIIQDKMKKRAHDIASIRTFLSQFGYASEEQLQKDINLTQEDLKRSTKALGEMQSGFRADTHFADNLRNELVDLSKRITDEEKALYDIRRKIDEQNGLKSELFALKFKLSRFTPAKTVLEGVVFEYCPSCGLPVPTAPEDEAECCLCRQKLSVSEIPFQDKVASMDIDNRISELEESISKHDSARISQQKTLDELKNQKRLKDKTLDDLMKEYDSKFLTQSRDLERQVAASEQKIASLGKVAEMPKAVSKLENELLQFGRDERDMKTRLDNERRKLVEAEQNIQQIEQSYKEALIAVSLPSFHDGDQVVIDRKTWIPKVIPKDKAIGKWSFENIGSAGVKTLLNVCYALVLHKVAQENDLPLPSLLILDSPSKDIDKEVNPKIHAALYQYIYNLSRIFGDSIQFLLIDNNYYTPPEGVEYIQRLMTQHDENNPGLIKAFKS